MEELWRRTKLGGKTKSDFEKGELLKDGRPATQEELSALFRRVRKIKTAELKNRERAEESSKTSEEIEFIGMVQQIIAKERERLGLAPGYFLELEETRLFHPDQWKLRDGHSSTTRGLYRGTEGLAESQTPPRDSRISPYAYFRTTSHEILHQASYHEADPLGSGGMRRRIGYLSYPDGLGQALNEALTEGINQQILTQYGDTLGSRFPDTVNGAPNKWWSEFSSYQTYRLIVRRVAERVDEILYGGTPTTWDNLERGYFENDGTALADIEKALGKPSLELLLLLGNPALFELNAQTSYEYIEARIAEYLTDPTISAAERHQIYDRVIRFRKQPETLPEGDVIDK